AAMNPCPCGYFGHPDRVCSDTKLQVDRYQAKISGPLRDRLDMHIEVPALRSKDLLGYSRGESSAAVRKRVEAAREVQKKRLGEIKTNSGMTVAEVKRFCQLDEACREILRNVMDLMGVSARACDRLIKVARTIADLNGDSSILPDHLMEAI